MTAITELQYKYASRYINLAGEQLLEIPDAIQLARDCQGLSIAVVGMEFFQRNGESITPTRIADDSKFSGVPNAVELSTKAASDLLSQALTNGE